MVSKENEERMPQSDSCWARQLSTCCRIGSKFRCTRSQHRSKVCLRARSFCCQYIIYVHRSERYVHYVEALVRPRPVPSDPVSVTSSQACIHLCWQRIPKLRGQKWACK